MVSATDYGGFAHDVGNALVGKQRQGSFDVVKPAHSFVVIGQQGIGQAQGCAETAMAIHGVWADPDDCPVQGHDGFMYITEATRFNGSPLGEIFDQLTDTTFCRAQLGFKLFELGRILKKNDRAASRVH